MGNLKDFATGVVVTPPSPATSGTSVTLQTGEGARMPTTPFYAVAHPPSQMPTLDVAEKIQVTNVTSDTLTIVRAQGGTTAQSISAGWRISNTVFRADIPLTSDDLTDGTTYKQYSATEKTKLAAISGTNTGDQTTITGNAGTATKLATARAIDGVNFDGSAPITVIAPATHAATAKTTPVDADETNIADSAASFGLKKVTWANIKATLKTYFDALYPTVDASGVALASVYGNLIINGTGRTAQRVNAPNLSTTSQYGKVDRFRCHATGTAVTAGTVNQDSGQAFGSTGYTLKIAGATITGTGIVVVRHRIESKDALSVKNLAASFSALVYHDVGSSVNYTIKINKATALDDFTSTTNISTSSSIPVASATATKIALENVSMGDTTNGIEIEISAACGAVTTKNFHYTDMQFNRGAKALAFLPDNFEQELKACQRYWEKSYSYNVAPGSALSNTYTQTACFRDNGGGNQYIGAKGAFRVTKRLAVPTAYTYNPITGAGTNCSRGEGATGTNYSSPLAIQASDNDIWLMQQTSGSDFQLSYCWVIDAEL